MDQKLLNALDNISEGLQQLAESLAEDKEAKSATAEAIQSGNFGKQLQTISENISEIKTNTEEILKNQKTIIDLSKERESKKTQDIEVSKEREEQISRGVGTILMIAVAVLAIGSAFNLVGSVDVLSVIGLSLAITIISIAFEKIAKLDLDVEQASIASGAIVVMSIAFAVSSYFLARTSNVSPSQFASLIVMSSAFAIMSYGIKNMIDAFDGVSLGQVVTASIFIPIILPVLAWSISKASGYLAETKSIGLASFFGAILTSGVFVVLSFAMKNIVSSFQGMDFETAVLAAGLSSILFVGFSFAIMASSKFLSATTPIGLSQFFSAAMVSGVFVILSFGLRQIIKSFQGMDFKTAIVASAAAPLIFTTLSLAIMASSQFLKDTANIDSSKMLNILLLSGTLAVAVSLMILPIKLIDKLKVGLGTVLKGGIAIVAIAGVIAASSQILNLGNYEDYPNLDWISGVSLSLLTFGVSAIGLGLFVAGPQALIFAAGMAAILGVAGTIVATSKILQNGNYNNTGMYDWAKSTALLFGTFAPIIIALGAVGIASSVVQAFGADNPFEKANRMMLDIASTIVHVSFELQKGSYAGGPSEDWAKGTALAIGAFAPVYEAISNSKGFFSSGISVEDMTNGIRSISNSIIESASIFNSNRVGFTGSYPSEKWSKGVGGAITAFAPVFDLLMEKTGFFTSGKSVINDIKDGIKGIAQSIVEVAGVFSSENVDWESYPDKEWSSNVGKSIGSFTAMAKYIDDEDANYKKVLYTANKISEVARILYDKDGIFSTSIDSNYVSGISKNIIDFNNLVKEITNEGDRSFLDNVRESASDIFATDPIVRIAKRMVTLAEGYDTLASSLINLGTAMRSLNVTDFNDIVKFTGQITNPEAFDIQKTESGASGNDENNNTNVVSETKSDKKQANDVLEEKLDKVIELLSNIDNSTSSLNNMLRELSEENEGDPEEGFKGFLQKMHDGL
jgi:hypothetical protein